jgi:uncharacterized protein
MNAQALKGVHVATAVTDQALATRAAPTSDPGEASLIEFPCDFPVKVMGLKIDAFAPAMLAVAQRFDPGFNAAQVTMRDSAGGKYMAITLNITATSREQLDGIYGVLSKHPMVKMAL